jgi:hypothetical protein
MLPPSCTPNNEIHGTVPWLEPQVQNLTLYGIHI